LGQLDRQGLVFLDQRRFDLQTLEHFAEKNCDLRTTQHDNAAHRVELETAEFVNLDQMLLATEQKSLVAGLEPGLTRGHDGSAGAGNGTDQKLFALAVELQLL